VLVRKSGDRRQETGDTAVVGKCILSRRKSMVDILLDWKLEMLLRTSGEALEPKIFLMEGNRSRSAGSRGVGIRECGVIRSARDNLAEAAHVRILSWGFRSALLKGLLKVLSAELFLES